MKQIFRISGATLLAGVTSFVLAPVSMPVLGQTAAPQSITCQPSTVSVAPSSGNLLVTCTSPGGGTPPPPSCLVSVSPTTLSSGGGTVTVSASCGTISSWTGTSPTTAVSTANGQTPVPSSFTDNLPANSGSTSVSYTYTVVGANGTNSAAVVVSGTSGGGGGTTSCGTPVAVAWGSYNRGTLTIAGGGTGLAQFTVGKLGNPQPKIIIGNGGGGAGLLPVVALASSPCTFPTASDPVIGGGPATVTGLIYFSLSGTPSMWMPVLTSGNTYYVNLKNPSGKPQVFYVDIYD